ncbi:MAG: hypothetical protein LUC44_06165 [Prevotellaceae bacterium]|nr:hypothetical protein [Prevotellaceae bacterium]
MTREEYKARILAAFNGRTLNDNLDYYIELGQKTGMTKLEACCFITETSRQAVMESLKN